MISSERLKKLNPTRIVLFYREEGDHQRYVELEPGPFLRVIQAAEDVDASPDTEAYANLTQALAILEKEIGESI